MSGIKYNSLLCALQLGELVQQKVLQVRFTEADQLYV